MNSHRWQEIQTSFDELVELDPNARAGRLALLASSDPDLHQALESLLAADAEASARLAPVDGALLSLSTPALDPLGLAGRTISHFEVREPLGAGGMGVVYRAQDTRLGRPVALKFLLPQYTFDAVAKARFMREAHSAGALEHPNLCAIHEVGTSDDGWLFMAMPLYHGETLRARLAREGPMQVREALEIARQVAEGLQAAHAAGIIHRDLKPANLMLLPDGVVKILDFGLAKARDQSLSETGARLGTVAYMSPEQIRGDAVDERVDVWALGVILYEMLTARKPFGGEEEVAITHAILHDQPVPISTYRRDVALAVEDVVFRLLQKDAARRYPSAVELLRDFDRAGTATLGTRDSLRRHLRSAGRALSGKRARVSALSVVITVSAVGAYAGVAKRNASSVAVASRAAIAVLPFRNLNPDSSHAYFVSGLHDEILTQLHKIPQLKVIARSSVMGYSGPKTPPLKQIAGELGVGTIVDAGVQVVGNRARVNVQLMDGATETPLWVEQYDRTLEDAFALQRDIAQQVVATVGVVLGDAERSALASVPSEKARAYLLYLQGKEFERRPERTQENLESAGRLYEQAIGLDSGFALAHAALAGIHAWMYIARYDMAPTRLARMRTEAETAVRLAPNSPDAHLAMGGALNVGPNTNPHAALKEWQLAARLAPNDPRVIGHLLSFYRQTGNWEEYEKLFKEIVELDPRNVDLLTDYGGETHARMGRFADAIHWFERVASITGDTVVLSLRKAFMYGIWKGDMRPLRTWMRGEGGRIARRNGWIIPQINFWLFERQPDSLLFVLKEGHQPVFQSAFVFEPAALWSAAAHELRGDLEAARAAYDSALAVADSGVRMYRDDFSVHVARGAALAGLGRRAEALDEVRKVRENFLFKDVWVREIMLAGIAQIHAKLGDANATVGALDEILSQRYAGLTIHVLRLDPAYDRIREHPRFRALLKKYANHPNLRSS
jgi:serine/threonine protein kinase/Flp pilus assembly protein TadD